MTHFEAYSVGLCYASVCTLLDIEEATDLLNVEYPTGVGLWFFANEPFKTGEANPCPCKQKPETHKHYLFMC